MKIMQATHSSMAAADRLAELHFTRRHMGSAKIHDVKIMALDPFLRGLLFTDGTVTRALEVHTLSSVAVDVVDQSPAPVPVQAVHYLELRAGVECLRRRVAMRLAGTAPAVWAESYIVPERLPADFLGSLDDAPHGIGGSLQQLKLESWRELLWFKLGSPPHWASTPTLTVTALIRLYRVITDGWPALLISEAFAVELRAGLYHLLGTNGPAVNAVSLSESNTATGEES